MKTLGEYIQERIKDCAQMSWACHYKDTAYWTGLHRKYSELNLSQEDLNQVFNSKIEVINYFGFES